MGKGHESCGKDLQFSETPVQDMGRLVAESPHHDDHKHESRQGSRNRRQDERQNDLFQAGPVKRRNAGMGYDSADDTADNGMG
jgi:hypothetical protein